MKVQVIEKKEGRIDRTTGEIIKGNLRVCAYARGGVRGSGRRKGNFSRKYPFSSRLYCDFCDSLLTRRNWHSETKNSITVWHCMEFVKHGKENCPHCKAIKESIIEETFTQSYKLLCESNKVYKNSY